MRSLLIGLMLLGINIEAPALEVTNSKYQRITLGEVLEAVPALRTLLPSPRIATVTGQMFNLQTRDYQIRSLYYQNKKQESAEQPLISCIHEEELSRIKKQDSDEQSLSCYIHSKELASMKPMVINQGYGPLLMYHVNNQDHYFYFCIRPQPLESDSVEADTPLRINPDLIVSGAPTYTLAEILNKLPHFASSSSSWKISPVVGQLITMQDGKTYEVRRAFFEHPLQQLPSQETVQSFSRLYHLLEERTVMVNYAGNLMNIFYRPAYNAEDHIVLYIALGVV